jgi:hypothetical protein
MTNNGTLPFSKAKKALAASSSATQGQYKQAGEAIRSLIT